MVDIDWSKLKFSYTKTRAIVYSRCIDSKWEVPVVTEDFNIPLSSFAGVFHYAPACFEGLKAFRGVDGRIRIIFLLMRLPEPPSISVPPSSVLIHNWVSIRRMT